MIGVSLNHFLNMAPYSSISIVQVCNALIGVGGSHFKERFCHVHISHFPL